MMGEERRGGRHGRCWRRGRGGDGECIGGNKEEEMMMGREGRKRGGEKRKGRVGKL